METSGEFEGRTKKEVLLLTREKDKLAKTLGGIRDMAKVPSAVWIVDTKKEHIAVGEARKLNIPVVAVLDTNCDPDEVDYPVPGNDDAIRSAALLTKVIAEAVAAGLLARSRRRRRLPPARSRWPSGSASCSPPVGRGRRGRAAEAVEAAPSRPPRCEPSRSRRAPRPPRPSRSGADAGDRRGRRRGAGDVEAIDPVRAAGSRARPVARSGVPQTIRTDHPIHDQ